MTFNTEFPDFPAADVPPLPQGFVDTSWHNDVCPSWSNDQLQIFVDYTDPALRETDGPRFTVFTLGDFDVVFQSNEWDEVLNFVSGKK